MKRQDFLLSNAKNAEPTITVTLTKSEALQVVDALTLAAQAADCDDAYRDNFHVLKWKFEC